MAKSQSQKKELYDKYLDALQNSQAIFVVDSSKLEADQVTNIRLKLFEIGTSFAVLKNSVFTKSYEQSDLKEQKLENLEGPTGAFFISEEGDPGAVAKVIKEFQKEFELMETKFGVLDGELLTADQVKAIADLPTREELLAKTVYVIAGPVKNLMGVMNGAVRDLTNVLKAIEEEKQSA